jgi:hypothetical protein
MRRPLWIRKLIAAVTPRRYARYIEGDTLPEKLPLFDVIVAREDNENWSVGLTCPCGCGQRLEMMLLKGVKPRWDISTDAQGRVSLKPSVWVRVGCRSHFWLRNGRIIWCD